LLGAGERKIGRLDTTWGILAAVDAHSLSAESRALGSPLPSVSRKSKWRAPATLAAPAYECNAAAMEEYRPHPLKGWGSTVRTLSAL